MENCLNTVVLKADINPRQILMQSARLPKMLLQEEANSIVTDTILDSSVGAAAKIVKKSL